MAIKYFRSAANYYSPKDGRVPACNVKLCKAQMIAYSADETECGLMVDCDAQAQALIESTGGVNCTRQSLADIYNFPVSFPPPLAH